jgi:hypothetical protein
MAITAFQVVTHITAGIILGVCNYPVAIYHVGVIVIQERFVYELLNAGLALLGMAH